MIFDTHAHYDDEAFNEDRDTVLPEINAAGVALILDPGCDMQSSRRSIELAEKYSFIYSAVGIHPEEIAKPYSLDELAKMAAHPKCRAIGEIGLDYYWDDTHKEEQKQIFDFQIKLALDMNMPIVVHDREAHGDSMEIIRKYDNFRGVFHCYSGSAEMAKELLKRGWYLGFDGPVTYKNARKTLEVLEICPLDRILIETDSPYMSPVPMRGKRNDSRNLVHVIRKIAEIKGETAEKIEEITCNNGRELFNI